MYERHWVDYYYRSVEFEFNDISWLYMKNYSEQRWPISPSDDIFFVDIPSYKSNYLTFSTNIIQN